MVIVLANDDIEQVNIMTIDSINGQQNPVIDSAAAQQTVSTKHKQAFEQRLSNVAQSQYLLDQANQALVNGEPKLAARYLSELAQQISGDEVSVRDARDYR